MARAGWETHLLPEFDGTWEEMPTNALDLLAREQRWCQGNLQHLRVLAFPGLRGASRGHLALGIGGYLMVPLWWSFLILGAVRVLLVPEGAGYGVLAYGATESGLAAVVLTTMSAGLVLLPRILNIIRALSVCDIRRSFGGARRLVLGAAIEQGLWLLLGPMLALVTAGFVIRTLSGAAVGWAGQSRLDRRIAVLDAIRHQVLIVALGCAFVSIAIWAGGWLEVWMIPTGLGLVLSPVLTAISSRRDLGQLSQRWGLFLTVDDVSPAPEILEFQALRQSR